MWFDKNRGKILFTILYVCTFWYPYYMSILIFVYISIFSNIFYIKQEIKFLESYLKFLSQII